jgi:carbon starvation protein
MLILWASTRRGGTSLAEIARAEIGPIAGTTAAVAILFIVIIALAGLGLVVVNALAESAWWYFIWTGGIDTIWPMFGIANQLLAVVALAIATTIIVNLGRTRYAWVTAAPMAFLATTTLRAGFLSVRDNFWPKAIGANPAMHVQGWVDTVLTIIMMICVAIVLSAAIRRWFKPVRQTA